MSFRLPCFGHDDDDVDDDYDGDDDDVDDDDVDDDDDDLCLGRYLGHLGDLALVTPSINQASPIIRGLYDVIQN